MKGEKCGPKLANAAQALERRCVDQGDGQRFCGLLATEPDRSV
jgi:hypothetical protein